MARSIRTQQISPQQVQNDPWFWPYSFQEDKPSESFFFFFNTEGEVVTLELDNALAIITDL